MDPYEEEFETLVRSVTTKIKTSAFDLRGHSPYIFSPRARVLQELKEDDANCQRFNTSATNDVRNKKSFGVTVKNSSISDKSGQTQSTKITDEASANQKDIPEVIAALNRKKQSVNEIVLNWKVVNPEELDPVDSSLSEDSDVENMFSERKQETVCVERDKLCNLDTNNQQDCQFLHKVDACKSKQMGHVSLVSPSLNANLHESKLSEDGWISNSERLETRDVCSEEIHDNGRECDYEKEVNEEHQIAFDDTKDEIQGTTSKQSASTNKITELDEWTVQPYCSGVRVEGHRLEDPADQYWHSSKIVKRLSSHLLQTSSGSLYKLVGEMDKDIDFCDEQSRQLSLLFENGFPKNWKQLVTDYNKGYLKNSRRRNAKSKKDKLKQKVSTKSSSAFPFVGGRKNAGNINEPLSINTLPKTRSGRVVIPPLSFWTGQRLWIDPETQAVQVIQGSPNTIEAELSLSFQEDQQHGSRLNRQRKEHKLFSNIQKKKKSLRKEQNCSKTTSTGHSRKLAGEKVEKKMVYSCSSTHPCSTTTKRKKLHHSPVTCPNQITAGVGTMKRKRQLKEMFEHQRKLSVDDIYDDSKNDVGESKVPKLNSLRLISELNDLKTPKPTKERRPPSRKQSYPETPYHQPQVVDPVSEKRTPYVKHYSPESSVKHDRNLDRYIYKLRRDLHGHQWGVVASKSKSPNTEILIEKPKAVLDPELLKTDNHEEEEGEEEDDSDYYFSD